MHEFEFLEPASVAEASRMLADHGDDARAVAGGSALLLGMRQRMLAPTHLVSLHRLDSLRGISFDPRNGLRIGALSVHSQVARSHEVQRHYPMLAWLAAHMANPQIRNQGTIGGNLCYADPSTDPPGCLLALDAQVVVAGLQGQRVLAMDEFLVDYFSTALQPDEIVTEIRIPPPPPDALGRYARFRRTAAEHRPLVNVSVAARVDGARCIEARVAIGASVPIPCRVPRAEAVLRERIVTPELAAEAAAAAAQDIFAISDSRGSEDYRREMVGITVKRTLAAMFGHRAD
jgi:carbon-monoxide dehydrogenase medium subunit